MDRHRRSLAGQALQFGTPYIVPPSGGPHDVLVHEASYTLTALNGVPLVGMGTKAWSQPAWDAVESGSAGTRFHAGGRYPLWQSFGATAARYTFPECRPASPNPVMYHPLYDTEHVRGGDHCTKAVKQHYYSELVDGGTAVVCQGSNYVSCSDYPATLEVYCSFWRYLVVPPGHTAFTPSAERDQGSRNWKHCNSGNSNDWGGTGYPQQRYDVYPAVGNGHHFLNFAGPAGTGTGAEIAQNWGTGTSMLDTITDQNVWQRFDVYTRVGTVAGKDWRLGHWKDGVLTSWLDPTTHPSQADQPVYDEPSGRPLRGTSVNFYCSPSSAKVLRSDQGYPEYYIVPNFGADFWLDDLYLDCSRARVELGNAATWAACTVREIQPWTAWADGSVTVTVNHGTLAHGTQYLYAIKPDGTPFDTNGQPVTLW